jgi:hypothetical protein
LANRGQDALATGGAGNRLADARIAARNAENPVAGGLQGALKGALGSVGGAAIVEAFDAALNNQTETLVRETARPAVVPGTN